MIIHSSLAYFGSVIAIIGTGFIYVWLPKFPVETVVTGIVAVTVAYFTKRAVGKHRSMLEKKYD